MKLLYTTKLEEYGMGNFTEYRIPAIVVTKKGTIITACESRREAGNDWSGVWITIRRSVDGGKTFSRPVYPHESWDCIRSGQTCDSHMACKRGDKTGFG